MLINMLHLSCFNNLTQNKDQSDNQIDNVMEFLTILPIFSYFKLILSVFASFTYEKDISVPLNAHKLVFFYLFQHEWTTYLLN